MTVRSLIAACCTALTLFAAGCAETADDSTASPERAAVDNSAPAGESEAEPGSDPAGSTQDSPTDADSTSPSPAAEAPEALQFTATTVEGAEFDGRTLVGKPTLLWFWAPWCPTCLGQVPEVEGLASQYAGELNVVGVGGLDSGSAIEDFAEDTEGITHLVDEEGAVWQRFGITEQSSYVLLDADGNEVLSSGYGEEVDLSGQIAEAVS
ncbi:MAG: redoxin family protein [Nocardioidaceae bacterium]|nr:redoxin family protein [Nocardioidaceae bacterium]